METYLFTSFKGVADF